jgi:hypothetical protein
MLLLALRDREGIVASGAWSDQAMAGGLLAELLLSGRIEIDESKGPKKPFVSVARSERVADPLLDECLRSISDSKRPRSPQDWVGRFAAIRELKHRVAKELCRAGILRADEDKVLLIFSRKIYPEVAPEPEREIVERLRRAIFTDTEDVDALEQLSSGEGIAAATQGAVEAVQAAMFAAVIIPSVITPTIISS